PESSYITVTNGYPTYPYRELLGQGISPSPKITVAPTPEPGTKICILGATYGALYTTGTGRNKHLAGKYVDVTQQLETLVKGGDTSFQFNVATIEGLTNSDSAPVPGGDPDPNIVKNAIVIYTVNGHLHIQVVMEQDYPSYKGQSTYIPYPVPTQSITLTL